MSYPITEDHGKRLSGTYIEHCAGFLPGMFFRGGGKIYCYVNFFCYANFSVLGPNSGGPKLSEGGQTASGGAPLPPCGRKPVCMVRPHI